jgi:subtilase family serine protease
MPAITWAEVRRRAARPGLRGAVALPAAAALAGAFVVAGPVLAANASATVTGTHPAWATASADRGEAGSSSPISTTVYLAGQNPTGMAAYAQAVSNPADAAYHHYLTPEQFQARYGATAQQVQAVENWLRSSGLTITAVDDHTITASGSISSTEHAYGTDLRQYTVKGQTYRAPSSDAQIPASVSSAVLTVDGLDNMPLKMTTSSLVGQVNTPLVKGVTDAKATVSKGSDGAVFLGPSQCSAYYGQLKDKTDPAFNGKTGYPYAICGYVPAQLRGAYGVTSTGLTGKGVTVAIVDAYGSFTMLADANQYAANHGDPTFRSGQYTETVTPSQWTDLDACQGQAGWAVEESLDVEAVHAMAPGAKIHYYGANSCNDPDFLKVFDSIVDHRSADVVSNSWGGVIYSTTGTEAPAVLAEYTHTFAQGAIEGISFQFSSGDCGAEDPNTACGQNDTSTTPQTDFPSSIPLATSVGGTSVAIDKHNSAEWTTVWGTDAWADLGSGWTAFGWQYGAGGGTSAVFSQPWYQVGVVPTKLAETLPDGTKVSSKMRVTPDVSMDADPWTGFLFGETQVLPDGSTGYAESDIGGTSLACPLFAGLQADVIQLQGGEDIGFANPAIYDRFGSPAFTDVKASGPGLSAVNSFPAFQGGPPIAVTFGDDQLLTATRGYDDATGVGTPSPWYLWSHFIW